MQRLIALLAIAAAVLACGGSNDAAPLPQPASATNQTGREIGETYFLLLEDAKAMLALELPAPQLRLALRSLQEDYRVRFANLGCLREALDAEEQLPVTRAADEVIFRGGGQDMAWLTQASTRYASDPELSTLLAQLPSVRLYAFFDQLARVRPGEQILCN
jgi:hypothetical protein